MTSFLEVGPALPAATDVRFLLTECFTQDPIESFFGDQRSRAAGTLTLQQYSINTNILCVSNRLSRIERGNIRGKERDSTPITTTELRKRKQPRN